MADHLKNSVLPRALSDVVADVADLFQKELRLARAEISTKLPTKLRAGVWMAIAAALAIVALVLLVQALVLGLAAGLDIALHWSCLIVAAMFGILAAAVYGKAQADIREDLTPSRAIHQVKRDIQEVKEQLT
jgi:hypothetical protein